MFVNTRCSISAICVLVCEHASSASGVQQLERPTASALISACLKHTFQKGILKRARYENSTFLLIFFPQVVDIFPVCCFLVFFFWLQVTGFWLQVSWLQNTAKIYMFHEDSTTIHRITSHILRSAMINQTKEDIFISSFIHQGYH